MMLNSSLMDEEELATRQKARKCFNSWCLDCSIDLVLFSARYRGIYTYFDDLKDRFAQLCLAISLPKNDVYTSSLLL
jgi:hypothetical protein